MPCNMMIGQSGGPTAAINASLAGAIKRAMKTPDIGEIYGARNGLEGLLQERIVNLRERMTSTEDFKRLENTPAMALGSCRYRLPPMPDAVYQKIEAIFEKYDIGYFFYIGGNDSMDTVMRLSEYFKSTGKDVRCVGIPKTIDNDLPQTDHTPGFGSAARYVASTVAEIACDSEVYDIASVSIVEIMGRNAGWLTAASVLARRDGCAAPHLIYLPEIPFDTEKFGEQVKSELANTKNVVVAVSEGVRFANGEYVSAESGKTDAFGHRMLTGVGKYLEKIVSRQIGCKARSIELNILQRSASHLYSETDIGEACRIGAEAVALAVQGKTGVMAVFKRISNAPYLVAYDCADIRSIANQEKKIPLDWIDESGCDVRHELIEYLSPLISDSNGMGIPIYFSLK